MVHGLQYFMVIITALKGNQERSEGGAHFLLSSVFFAHLSRLFFTSIQPFLSLWRVVTSWPDPDHKTAISHSFHFCFYLLPNFHIPYYYYNHFLFYRCQSLKASVHSKQKSKAVELLSNAWILNVPPGLFLKWHPRQMEAFSASQTSSWFIL